MINIADKNTWLIAKHNAAVLPHWFRKLQEQQLAEFVMPTTRNEQWKYTDVAVLTKQPFVVAEKTSVNSAQVQKHHLVPAIILVFVNGHFAAELSTLDKLPQDTVAISLKEAWQRYPELVKTHLANNFQQQPFAQLNTVLVEDGLFVYVPKNTSVTVPIQLLFVSDAQRVTMSTQRNVIIVDENSEVDFLESYISLNSTFSHFNNIVTQIFAAKNARIQHYKLQSENVNAMHIACTQVEQQANSSVHSYHFSLGSQLAREDISINLNGQGAECKLLGLYLAYDKQHIDYHTRIDHRLPHTQSDEFFKGILTDQAKGVFNGKVIVHPNAQKTNAKQVNKNLLLTKTAEINAKPELEIYADDVRCTHGATVGQLDDAALFYLRSRGIAEQEAIYLLIDAFAGEIFDKIKSNVIRDYIKLHVLAKLV